MMHKKDEMQTHGSYLPEKIINLLLLLFTTIIVYSYLIFSLDEKNIMRALNQWFAYIF